MTTGNSLTQAREQDLLKALLRQTTYTAPSAVYAGLFGAAKWQASHSYPANSFVLPTTWTGRIFKSGGSTGTSGGSEPTWPTTNGGTVADNTVTWTEQTLAMDGIADSTTGFISELSGSNYARVSMTSSMGAPSAIGGSATGSQSQNTVAITFAQASADWLPALGFFLVDSSPTGGKYLLYGIFGAYLQINNGQQAQFNASGLTVQLD